MRFDPDLADRLSAFPVEAFAGEVFRATRVTADPVAPSLYVVVGHDHKMTIPVRTFCTQVWRETARWQR